MLPGKENHEAKEIPLYKSQVHPDIERSKSHQLDYVSDFSHLFQLLSITYQKTKFLRSAI
jgi:hypothetical protein